MANFFTFQRGPAPKLGGVPPLSLLILAGDNCLLRKYSQFPNKIFLTVSETITSRVF